MKKFITLVLAGIGALTVGTAVKQGLEDRKLDNDVKKAFPESVK